MAYLKDREQELEIDFPLESVWEAIPKAVAELDWKIKEKNNIAHSMIIHARGNLTSYGSMVKIELNKLNEKTTRVIIVGETPVTTITATLNFSQTDNTINDFILTLARIMNS